MATSGRTLAEALADRYRIESPIGAGGMGTVYAAQDLRHGRRVAIKVLRPELASAIGADRFLREIQVVARLHHPHILQLHDSGEVDGFLYFVMPLVEGESLRQRLDRDGKLPVRDAMRILREVIDGLAEAHRAGIVHRDIKPDNILLEGRHALLADFGLAKQILATSSGALTSAGLAIGTPRYMAPEQAVGSAEADERTDLYAIGVMAYEMLAGVPPVDGATPQKIMARQVTATPVPLGEIVPEVPAALAQVVMQCLAKDPAERPQSADEVLGVLEGIATPSGGRTPTSARLVATRSNRAWPWIVAAGAVGIFALGAVLLRPKTPTVLPQSTQRQLTFRGDVVEAAISPDGASLAFIARSDSGDVLYLRDERGGAEVPLMRRPQLSSVNWAPTARAVTVATCCNLPDTLYQVAVAEDPLPPVLLGSYGVQLRPDGKTFLETADNVGGVGLIVPPLGCLLLAPDSFAWTLSVAQDPTSGRLAMLRSDVYSRVRQVSVIDPAGHCDGPIFRVDSVRSMRVDTARVQLLVPAGPNHFTALVWALDGNTVYALDERADGTMDLQRLPALGGAAAARAPVTLARGLEFAAPANGDRIHTTSLSLARGGTTAAYVRGRTAMTLEAVTLAGDGAVTSSMLTTGTSANSHPQYAPDGRSVAYLSKRGPQLDLRVRNLETGEDWKLPVSDTVAMGRLAWSPDAKQLAFPVRQGGATRVAVASLEPPIRIQVYSGTKPSIKPDMVWAPSRVILYQADSVTDYFTLDPSIAAAGEPLFRSAAAGARFSLAVQPGGAMGAVLVTAEEHPGMFLVDLVTGRAKLLQNGRLWPVAWTPGGDKILAYDEANNDIVAVDLSGTKKVLGHLPFAAAWFNGITTDGKGHFIVTKARPEGDVWAIDNFDPEYTTVRTP